LVSAYQLPLQAHLLTNSASFSVAAATCSTATAGRTAGSQLTKVGRLIKTSCHAMPCQHLSIDLCVAMCRAKSCMPSIGTACSAVLADRAINSCIVELAQTAANTCFVTFAQQL
jgi:hypothetical protein